VPEGVDVIDERQLNKKENTAPDAG
jgi:hypothetical protein